jgi:hypothetical protein
MNVRITATIIIFTLLVNNIVAQVSGCTDPVAENYNRLAISNDGSCTYSEASISPSSSINITDTLSETSGLTVWNNQIWTFNDNGDTNIYSLDTITGKILQTVTLNYTINNEWEEISQDNNYLYIGDFGNNVNGNRTDLKILRIDKNSILNNSPKIDTIAFIYSNQDNFTPAGNNNTDFDCEAFIVSADSIYLFTKQWVSNKTSVYSLSKSPGTFTAHFKYTYDIGGLITGAIYFESKSLIVLCGYSNLLQPFIYLLYDFYGSDYFSGNKRKIAVSLPFYQVEGIASNNGLKYYISNEYFTQPPFITTLQNLHTLELNTYLGNYLKESTYISSTKAQNNFSIYPNPVSYYLTFKAGEDFLPANYHITNQTGQVILSGDITTENTDINISDITPGIYLFSLVDKVRQSFVIIKK